MTAATPQVAPAAPARRVGRVLLVIAGSIATLIAVGLLAASGFVIWANTTQRDGAGYFRTSTHTFASSGYAISHRDGVDLGDAPKWIGDVGTVRVSGTGAKPIFIGIGRTSDVAAYLRGVERDDVQDVSYGPFSVDYTHESGTAPAGAPTAQTFWSKSVAGSGKQALTWKGASGTWSLVVMNADGSRDVNAGLAFGAKIHYLGWIAFGLIALGLVLLASGASAIFFGARTPAGGGGGTIAAPPTQVAAGEYPVSVDARLDEPLSRGLWLVKWLLAIPHFVALVFLWIAALVMTIVAFFAILFTGRYPRGIFDFNVGVLRWTWRVSYYTYDALGTDRYPPFSLGPEPDYPATLDIPYPEHLSRRLVLVKWWLLAIPHYLVIAVFTGGGLAFGSKTGHWEYGLGGGLITLLAIIAAVVLLFTGRYPRDIHKLVVGMNRWVYRVAAYALLMRDEYPPFRLEP